MGIIYRLSIGDFWYVGRTTRTFKARYNQHKKACFNTRKKQYWCKKYLKFRQLGVKRHNWDEMVKWVIVKDCDNKYLDYYENFFIDLECPLNINTQGKKVFERYEKDLTRCGVMTPEERKVKRDEYNAINNLKNILNGYVKKNNLKNRLNGNTKITNAKNNKANCIINSWLFQ